MKRTIACLAGGLLAVGVQATIVVENFDTFNLGVLTAQQGWEANSGVDVVATANNGLYIGGRALKSNTAANKTFRMPIASPDFGLDKVDYENGYEYGFDVREDDTTVFNTRMYLRRSNGRYSPSVGFLNGNISIRSNGEGPGSTSIEGLGFYTDAIYGEGTVADPGYWLKGDWLQVKLLLTGAGAKNATVKVYNLSRNNLEIPTGLTDVDLSVYANGWTDGYWGSFNVRGGPGVTTVDNVYVKNIPEPLTLSLLGGTSLLVLAARRFFLI